jgi:hypothetical protein
MCAISGEHITSGTIGFRIDDPLTLKQLESLHEECVQVFDSNDSHNEWHISLGSVFVHNEHALNDIIHEIRQIAALFFSNFYVSSGIMEALPQTKDKLYSLGCKLSLGNRLANADDGVLESLYRVVEGTICAHGELMNAHPLCIIIDEMDETFISRVIPLGVSSRLSPLMLNPQNIDFFPYPISGKRRMPFNDCENSPLAKYQRIDDE